MEDISYNVYYAVRNSNKQIVLYDSPSKEIDGTLECIRLQDINNTHTYTHTVSSTELGIHQLVYTMALNPGTISNISEESYPLKNVGYDGSMNSPKERIITKFTSPYLSTVSTLLPTQANTFLDIPTSVSDTLIDPISNYLLVNLETDEAQLSGVYGGVDITKFHDNIRIDQDTFELIGYILHVNQSHYTSNVKRNGTWWGVNDIESDYETMVSSSGPMAYGSTVFTKDGRWDPNNITDKAYPVILLYKNLNKAWNVEFTNNNPGVIKNPRHACYALSPIVLFANIPEIVSSLIGKTKTSTLLRNKPPSDEEIVAVAISAVEDTAAAGRHVNPRNKQTRRRRLGKTTPRNTRRRRPRN